MNTTTATILHEGAGYYLVNALNQSRLDLQLVDAWWGSRPDMLRNQIFTNQQSDYYPRYNVTIDGVEYFVIDPSPVSDRWNGEWSIQNAMYRYPNIVTVMRGGITSDINLFQNGYWNGNLTVRQLNTINIDDVAYDLGEQFSWKPSYQVTIDNVNVPIQMETMNVYKTHQSWGNIFTWK